MIRRFFPPGLKLKDFQLFGEVDSKSCACVLQSCLTLCDPLSVAHQAPLFMGFSRQECCSGLPCLPLGNLPDPGIKPGSLKSPALAGGFFTTSTNREVPLSCTIPHSLLCGFELVYYQLKQVSFSLHLKILPTTHTFVSNCQGN